MLRYVGTIVTMLMVPPTLFFIRSKMKLVKIHVNLVIVDKYRMIRVPGVIGRELTFINPMIMMEGGGVAKSVIILQRIIGVGMLSHHHF